MRDDTAAEETGKDHHDVSPYNYTTSSSNLSETTRRPQHEEQDPFSPDRLREASSTLLSLRNRSLTIFNLSTKVSPLSDNEKTWRFPQQNPETNENDDEKERRYNLAFAIAKHAYESRTSVDVKRSIYHLALTEYYKLLRLDLHYTGVLESVLLLLSILGYDDHCNGLMDFVLLSSLEEDPSKEGIQTAVETNHLGNDEEELLHWVYGDLSSDPQPNSLQDRLLGVLDDEGRQTQQQWCSANAFLIPSLLITLRKNDNNNREQSAKIGIRIEQHCSDKNLPFLRGLLSNSDTNTDWNHEEAIRVFSQRKDGIFRQAANRWEESCLLFWKILKDCIEENETLHRSLMDTIFYMEKHLNHPATVSAIASSTETASSLLDLLSDTTNPKGGNLFYCIHCRQRLSPPGSGNTATKNGDFPAAMRCSRCCAVHYCSRNCQKRNYSLHKERCKNISALRAASLLLSVDNPNIIDNKAQQYDLAYALVDMAYVSTDTVDRGRKIYQLALFEYYRLLRKDFYYPGALESTLMFLALLGYDEQLLGLVDFVVCRLLEKRPNDERISISPNGKDDDTVLLEWARGLESNQRSMVWKNLELLSLVENTQWSANNFLLPLLFWSLRKQSRQRTLEKWNACTGVSASIARAIQQQSTLPVLRGLLPDSVQRWGQDEASDVLARSTCCGSSSSSSSTEQATKHWQESCLLVWEILKDAIALTPKVADALGETIETMERDFHVSATPEVPQNLSEYAAWSSGMAEQIR